MPPHPCVPSSRPSSLLAALVTPAHHNQIQSQHTNHTNVLKNPFHKTTQTYHINDIIRRTPWVQRHSIRPGTLASTQRRYLTLTMGTPTQHSTGHVSINTASLPHSHPPLPPSFLPIDRLSPRDAWLAWHLFGCLDALLSCWVCVCVCGHGERQGSRVVVGSGRSLVFVSQRNARRDRRLPT